MKVNGIPPPSHPRRNGDSLCSLIDLDVIKALL